jgi:hypothetical protein
MNRIKAIHRDSALRAHGQAHDPIRYPVNLPNPHTISS